MSIGSQHETSQALSHLFTATFTTLQQLWKSLLHASSSSLKVHITCQFSMPIISRSFWFNVSKKQKGKGLFWTYVWRGKCLNWISIISWAPVPGEVVWSLEASSSLGSFHLSLKRLEVFLYSELQNPESNVMKMLANHFFLCYTGDFIWTCYSEEKKRNRMSIFFSYLN